MTANASAALILAANPQTEDDRSVGQLLKQSLDHHLQYRSAVVTRDADAQQRELKEAAILRAMADQRDPTYHDAGWGQVVSLHDYQSFVQRDLHADLLGFYCRALGLSADAA